MLKKITALVLGIFFSISLFASDDEGMWLPLYLKQLNEKDMKAKGLKLNAEDIYNINNSSLKDAVVSFGGFCTGEIVSAEGLLFTNHHCGYDAIASNSTVEKDYLKNGFWAKSKAEELPNQGLTASILVYMKDVTDIIKQQTKDINADDVRSQRIIKLSDSIAKDAIKGTNYVASVKPYFKGNEYYLLVYEVYRDVRLVGAPPASIGKFGGDTDNWMWPRHTGDFSVFRIYTGPDGKPAPYSKDNIPMKPKKFFPVSLKGVKPNDYAMVLGFPGSTDRYLTSFDLETAAKYSNPAVIEALGTEIEVMKQDMEKDRALALTLASDYASTSNSYKFYQGQHRQLMQTDLIQKQKEEETKFSSWVNADPARKEKYGSVLSDIKAANDEYRTIEPALSYFGYGFFGANAARYGLNYNVLFNKAPDKKNAVADQKKMDSMAKVIKPRVKEYFKTGTFNTDKRVLLEQLLLIVNKLPAEKRPEFFKDVFKKFNTDDNNKAIYDYVNYIYENSKLLDSVKAIKFLDKPTQKQLINDPFFQLVKNMLTHYQKNLASVNGTAKAKMAKNHKLYIEALREWKKDKKFYPDANSTLRLSYGTVQSYIPRDAVKYNYYTTYEGILEKADSTSNEFNAPARQLELLKKKDFGRYAQNDTLRVNFLTDNDITGGNSGSPVLDGQGNLIGIAFDGNWESMISKLYVDPALNRTISVDIRYVLWVIDKYAGADNLIKELKIVE